MYKEVWQLCKLEKFLIEGIKSGIFYCSVRTEIQNRHKLKEVIVKIYVVIDGNACLLFTFWGQNLALDFCRMRSIKNMILFVLTYSVLFSKLWIGYSLKIEFCFLNCLLSEVAISTPKYQIATPIV